MLEYFVFLVVLDMATHDNDRLPHQEQEESAD
jgi:hypothetical protein